MNFLTPFFQVGSSELVSTQRVVNSGQMLRGPPSVSSANTGSHLSAEGSQSSCFPGTRQRSMSFDQQQPGQVDFDRRYSLVENEGPASRVLATGGRTDQPMDLRVLSTRARRLEILPGGIVSQPIQSFATRDPREPPHPAMLAAGGIQPIGHGGLSVAKQFATDSHETIMSSCMTYGQSTLADGPQNGQSMSMGAPLITSQPHLHSAAPISSIPIGPQNAVMSNIVVPKQEYVLPAEDRKTHQTQPSMQPNLHIPTHNGKFISVDYENLHLSF